MNGLVFKFKPICHRGHLPQDVVTVIVNILLPIRRPKNESFITLFFLASQGTGTHNWQGCCSVFHSLLSTSVDVEVAPVR